MADMSREQMAQALSATPPMPVADDYRDVAGNVSIAFWDALEAWKEVALSAAAHAQGKADAEAEITRLRSVLEAMRADVDGTPV
jgi:hypothetical protein